MNKLAPKYTKFLISSLFLLASNVNASSYNSVLNFNSTCPRTSQVLFFANGMFNMASDANDSIKALKEKTNVSYVDYRVAYNHNEFFLDQLFQVIEQKFRSEKYFYWKNMDLSNASSEFKNKVLEIVKSITEENYVKDADLKEHVNLYQKVFQNNQEVVIVSHSQGNFYAQSALNYLSKDGSVNVPINFLGVATPFKITADYVTLTSDGVINMIPGSPPANTSNTKGGLLKHQFVRDYLKGDNSGKAILKKLNDVIATKVGSSYGRENNPGYVHSSLSNMEKWVNSIENYYGYNTCSASNKLYRKLKRSECLAISIFYKTENWYNAPCESRNLTALIDGAKSCYNENWRGSFLAPMARCSLPGTTAALSPWSANYLDDNLAYEHPECAWTVEAPDQLVDQETFDQALSILTKPPVE